MIDPEVSIIITNYNYSRYLDQCIESCVAQRTQLKYEVIIIDDGSTDDSIKIIESYLNHNIHLIKLGNRGIEKAANVGFTHAKGELVVRVDADDYLMPGYLDGVVSKLKEATNCSFAYSDYLVVDSIGQILQEEKLPTFCRQEVETRGDFLATGTMYLKAFIERLNYYDVSVKNCGLENYLLILKLTQSGQAGLHIKEPLFAYRRHDLNISIGKRDAIVNYGRKLFLDLGLGNYCTNRYHPYKLKVDDE